MPPPVQVAVLVVVVVGVEFTRRNRDGSFDDDGEEVAVAALNTR